jgi:DnaJ-class molecular chaperone
MLGLIAVVLIFVAAYGVFCAVVPTKSCRRCSGWGSKPGRRLWGRRPQRRQCRKCDGTGRRFRVPARLAYRLRGATRRHGELTARAAARSAGTGSGGSEREQEQVTP